VAGGQRPGAAQRMAGRPAHLFGGGRMRYLHLLRIFFRVSVMGELAYRANFVLQLGESLLDLATALAGLAVVFSYTDDLGGWRPAEVLALVGVFFLVGGGVGAVIQPSMQRLIESVREGTLDFTLTKPEDAQLVVSIQRVEVWKLTDVVLGALVLAVALERLGAQLGPWQVAAFATALLAGAVIFYAFWLLLATLCFWFVRVENILMVFQSMYEAGRWPVSLYPRWLRFALTFLVPVAFGTMVPAQALAGRLTAGTLLEALGLALALAVLSRLAWRAGLRRYTGASA
jgi:viologen exporter family transport system permease protein